MSRLLPYPLHSTPHHLSHQALLPYDLPQSNTRLFVNRERNGFLNRETHHSVNTQLVSLTFKDLRVKLVLTNPAKSASVSQTPKAEIGFCLETQSLLQFRIQGCLGLQRLFRRQSSGKLSSYDPCFPLSTLKDSTIHRHGQLQNSPGLWLQIYCSLQSSRLILREPLLPIPLTPVHFPCLAGEPTARVESAQEDCRIQNNRNNKACSISWAIHSQKKVECNEAEASVPT